MLFCIVGTGRCGTRLLQQMMNLHPELFVYRETHWIPKMYEHFGTSVAETEMLLEIIRHTNHVNGSPTTPVDERKFKKFSNGLSAMTIRDFCDALGQMFAVDSGKKFWADKTPDYGYFMASLQGLWPECRFIHLIRDGAATAKSMTRHPGYQVLAATNQLNWCPLSFDYFPADNKTRDLPAKAFVNLWYWRLIRTRNEATRLRAGTYLEIRYEHLIQDPSAQLAKICSFVRISLCQSWTGAAAGLVRPQKLSPARPTEMLRFFGPKELRLLEELGYAAMRH